MGYDLIVVGLGAMGSAALYQAAKRGAKVLGIDRFSPPHQMGSSHAETRISRLAVGEGEQYLPLVVRSHEIWQEIEEKSGQKLFYQTGGYIINSKKSPPTKTSHYANFVARTAQIAQSHGFPFILQSPAKVRNRYPHLSLHDNHAVGFEPSGGLILCERAIETQLTLARQHGAVVHVNEPMVDLQDEDGGVMVTTELGAYHAAKGIIAAGAWLPAMLPSLKRDLFRVTRQAVYWFEPVEAEKFSVENFPYIIWLDDTKDELIGIFPMPPHGTAGVKMLTEQYEVATSPETVQREVTQAEIDRFYARFVAPKFRGVTPNCVRAAACLYTNTPDDHFVIDFHPESEKIMIISACSGHGFKHSAAVGEAVAQQILNNGSSLDLTPFRLGRFA